VGEEVEAHEEEEDGHGEADEDFGAFETVRGEKDWLADGVLNWGWHHL